MPTGWPPASGTSSEPGRIAARRVSRAPGSGSCNTSRASTTTTSARRWKRRAGTLPALLSTSGLPGDDDPERGRVRGKSERGSLELAQAAAADGEGADGLEL